MRTLVSIKPNPFKRMYKDGVKSRRKTNTKSPEIGSLFYYYPLHVSSETMTLLLVGTA